jgi:hypothetical protein
LLISGSPFTSADGIKEFVLHVLKKMTGNTQTLDITSHETITPQDITKPMFTANVKGAI